MSSKAASSSQVASSDKVQPPFPAQAAIGAAEVTKEQESHAAPADGQQRHKRQSQPEDEIDQLFEANLGKKVKRTGLRSDTAAGAGMQRADDQSGKARLKGDTVDKGLVEVLGAIKLAPKDDSGHRAKRKK